MMRRRELLGWGGAALGVGLLPRGALAADELIAYVGRPQDLGTPLETFDRLITPTPVFFVRSHFGPPALVPSRRLRVDGLVDRPLDLGIGDLKQFEEVTITSVLQCAGNGRALHSPRVPGVQWEHGAMGQATWTGVRLADVLKKAGVQPTAAHLRTAGADLPPKPTVPQYARGLPLARALDPSTLIAYRMNGEPLTLQHGAPLRLVVPGWTGNHWVKWLTSIHVQKDEVEGFYSQTAYRFPIKPMAPGAAVAPSEMRPVTSFPVRAVIARPAEGATLAPGAATVVGVAFSGAAPLARVEVSLDGGARWSAAALEGEPGAGRWQVFRHSFNATAGTWRATVRAVDKNGETQPERAQWNPSGYLWNAWHSVSFVVRAAVILLFALGARAARAEQPSQASRGARSDSEQVARADELVTNNCLSCHTEEMLTQQRLSEKQWAAVVKKMVGWGAPVEPENVEALVARLAAAYGPSAPRFEAPRVDAARAAAELARLPDGKYGGGNADKGKTLYQQACGKCHGADGRGSEAGMALADRPLLWRASELAAITRRGRARMPGFPSLSDRDMAAVIAYLRRL
jgi:DMSO/TMAO reductase YedYZ molybdopterin-dependent catalytic subunit/cytochrome c553